MLTIEKARFYKRSDGEYWACPCCGAKFARVEKVEMWDESALTVRRVAGLEMVADFVFNPRKGIYLKPENRLKGLRGSTNRQFRTTEQHRLGCDQARMTDAERRAREEQRPSTVKLSFDQLPAVVLCPNLQCAQHQRWEIPSVRSVLPC
jgi:rubredoxin